MLGLDRRALSAAWSVFLFVLAVALVYIMSHTLMVFALAVFLAHLISPAVELVERHTPRYHLSHAVASGITYLLLFAVSAAVIIPVGAIIGEQATIRSE